MKKLLFIVILFPLIAMAQDDPTSVCFKAAYNDPHVKILESHVGPLSDPRQATLAMLASKDTPTKQEQDALELWVAIRKTCTHQGSAFRTRISPQFESLVEDTQQRLISLTSQLYAGDITYGQFNNQRIQIATDAKQAISTLSTQLRAAQENQAALQRQQQAQTEADRRAMALQFLANRPQPAPLQFTPIQPTHQTFCNSVMGGSTVQTVCH